MNEIEKLAQDADFIVNGYAFFCNEATVRVLNLNNTCRATVINREGQVISTSMTDVEISIVLTYWNRNRQLIED